MSTLETKNLVKRFDGIHAVDHLSLSFDGGKITSVIGPNGSGKSTFINTLTGLHGIDGGTVFIGKHSDVSSIKPHEISSYGMTRTFQEVRLFEQMTVMDNILEVLTERGVWGSLFENHTQYHLDQAEAVLTRVGLWEKRNGLASGLSYGQRKLLEIARAISMPAEIFFFDEPFAGLFPEMIKVVVSVMQELRTKGKTVLLVEHNMDLIRQLSDYVFVLDSGKLLAEGVPEKVLSEKAVVEAYLGE